MAEAVAEEGLASVVEAAVELPVMSVEAAAADYYYYSKKQLKLKPPADFDAATHCVVFDSCAAIALAGGRWMSPYLNLVGGVIDSKRFRARVHLMMHDSIAAADSVRDD